MKHIDTQRPFRQVSVPSQSIFCKIHTPSPPLFHQEDLLKNISSVITVVIFTYNVVFRFSIFVSADSQKFSWYDVPWNMEQHTTLCCIISTCILFLFLCFWQNTHSTEFFYTAWATVCWVFSQVFLVGSWMGLVFFVLRSDVKAPFPTIVLDPSPISVWIVWVIILKHERWES